MGVRIVERKQQISILPGVIDEKPWKNLSQDNRPMGSIPAPPESSANVLPSTTIKKYECLHA